MDLVLEAEGAGLLLALVVVEQKARAVCVDALPEVVGSVPDLGPQDGRRPLTVLGALSLEGEHGPARVTDGRFQVGHLGSEGLHGAFIRQMYDMCQ
jgi:hypothetical protein